MIDRIAQGLDLRLGDPVTSIQRAEKRWLINGEEAFDAVISTIPLPELSRAMELPCEINRTIADLKYNSLTTVLCSCPQTDISWLYIPDKRYKTHRIGYQSALTPAAAPEGTGSGAFEIIGERFDVDRKILSKQDVVPDALNLHEVIDWEFTQYAYVIHDKNYRVNTKKVFDYFDAVPSFHLLGRFSTWNYKNMDMCMQDAFEVAARFE